MATSNKELLKRRVAETRREPRPSRLAADRPRKPGYRVVAVSLYTPEADWIDQTTKALQAAGNAKANRSLVVREAILRIQESLADKRPEEILQDFTEHQAKRARG